MPRTIQPKRHSNIINSQAQQIQVLSSLVKRVSHLNRLGLSYSNDRDLYEALGYIKNLSFNDFHARYLRGDIGKRIITLPVTYSWRKFPFVKQDSDSTNETPFEKEFSALVDQFKVFHYLQRVDKISGIGQYGVLLMGIDDGMELSEPVNPSRSNKLLFLRVFAQNNAEINTYNNDQNSERYGLPETYKLTLSLPLNGSTDSSQRKIVHYSRVIHIAENLDENEIYGTPRLEACYNRLQDLELVVGSSGEMWWRGAFPGLNFRADADADLSALSVDSMKDQIEEYVHGLRRYLRLQGITVDSISPQVTDPSSSADVQLMLISATTGIPKRILVGSERGELASSQDEENWLSNIDDRRSNYCEPCILRPFIDRCIEYKILPAPDAYFVEWEDLKDQSDKDRAEIAAKITEAVAKYASAPGTELVLPLEIFLSHIMNFDQEIIQKILGEVEKLREDEQRQIEEDERLMRDEDNSNEE